jgi:hypothetical protein
LGGGSVIDEKKLQDEINRVAREMMKQPGYPLSPIYKKNIDEWWGKLLGHPIRRDDSPCP